MHSKGPMKRAGKVCGDSQDLKSPGCFSLGQSGGGGVGEGKFLKSVLGYDYTIRFISCDSIQTCSFVSERFQSHTMI